MQPETLSALPSSFQGPQAILCWLVSRGVPGLVQSPRLLLEPWASEGSLTEDPLSSAGVRVPEDQRHI